MVYIEIFAYIQCTHKVFHLCEFSHAALKSTYIQTNCRSRHTRMASHSYEFPYAPSNSSYCDIFSTLRTLVWRFTRMIIHMINHTLSGVVFFCRSQNTHRILHLYVSSYESLNKNNSEIFSHLFFYMNRHMSC